MTNIHQIEPPRASEVAMTLIRKTIWQRFSNKSVVSGLWLREYVNTPLWPNCFLHVLPIKEYPYFKYYMKNIALMTPGERGLWIQGSDEDRIQYALDIEERSQGKSTANWSGVRELETELKKQYAKSFPFTYRGIIGYSYTLDDQKVIVGQLNRDFWEGFK